jgi:hypothetical protein
VFLQLLACFSILWIIIGYVRGRGWYEPDALQVFNRGEPRSERAAQATPAWWRFLPVSADLVMPLLHPLRTTRDGAVAEASG